ncbi:DUF4407 domain-containing protein [Dactylosporangium cerinum]|uniref:DUF4407 domain-containing protein n=1 Tax=Dactylosporangium cerinum TaxID=1434730 RepID=A0ABV9VWE6_9ACTN
MAIVSLHSRVAVLGGADPANPLESDNRVRHTAVGVLLLAVAIWAFVAATATFRSNLHAPWPVAITGGALIALIIFSIDLLITATPLQSDRISARLRVVASRGLISIAMGLVISHATILFMYQDTLAQMVSAKNTTTAATITERVTHESKYTPIISKAQERIDDDQKKIAAENQTLNEAQAHLEQLRKDWADDTVCVNGNRAANGDRCGPGPSSTTLREAFEAYRDGTMPAAVTHHDTQVAALTEDIKTQTRDRDAATASRNQEIDAAIHATLHNTGLAAQSDALIELLLHDRFLWLWPIFFIVIDLVVALMKGLLPESDFDRTRRTRRMVARQVQARLIAPGAIAAVASHAANQQAVVLKARIDRDTELQLAALRETGNAGGPWWRRAVATAVVLLIVLLALALGKRFSTGTDSVALPQSTGADLGAAVDQTAGERAGRRALTGPQCDPQVKIPAWHSSSTGLTDQPATVVLACLQGHPGDDVLDVQIVNNRPYGLMLRSNGTGLAWSWHQEAESVSGQIRDAIGDIAAGSHGLYLPPLSRASIGVPNLGNGGTRAFSILPTAATITADAFDVLTQRLLDGPADTATERWAQSVYGAAATGSCATTVLDTGIHDLPDPTAVSAVLTGDGMACIKAILTTVAQTELPEVSSDSVAALGRSVERLESLTARGLPNLGTRLGDLLDFDADRQYAPVSDTGFGFRVEARYTHPPGGTDDGGTDGRPQPLVFSITGTCTAAGGILSNASSGFTPDGRYTVEVRRPDGSLYTGNRTKLTGTVRGDGSIVWLWSCAGDPAGRYTAKATDEATGRSTAEISFVIAAA